MTAPLSPTTASDAELVAERAEISARLKAAIELGDRTGSRGKRPENIYNVAAEALDLISKLSAEVAAKDAEIEKLNSRLAFALDEGTSWACKAGRYARSATDAEAEAAGLRADLGRVLTWAESRCPCRHEEPNPCSLCGASVENLEACKSAENTLPRDILVALRSAKARASLPPRMETSDV